jgi:hypothetical protein
MESFGCQTEETDILTKVFRREFPKRCKTASVQLTYKTEESQGGWEII